MKLSGIYKGTNIFRGCPVCKRKNSPPSLRCFCRAETRFTRYYTYPSCEYVPAAVVPVEGGFMVVSKEGYCLRHCNEISNLNLPVVSGLGIKDMCLRNKVDNERLPVALEIVNCCDKRIQ